MSNFSQKTFKQEKVIFRSSLLAIMFIWPKYRHVLNILCVPAGGGDI